MPQGGFCRGEAECDTSGGGGATDFPREEKARQGEGRFLTAYRVAVEAKGMKVIITVLRNE